MLKTKIRKFKLKILKYLLKIKCSLFEYSSLKINLELFRLELLEPSLSPGNGPTCEQCELVCNFSFSALVLLSG